MNIEANKRRRIGLGVVAVMVGWTAWLAAVPGPGTGHSFTALQSPFTQDLFATASMPDSGVLGGVAFAPDGRVWSAECTFLGTRLHRFATATTLTNGSLVHQDELVVDLTTYGPDGAGGCGLVNHPDGAMYSSSTAGIWKLNATTGQVIAGPFGHGSSALGIAVDPQAGHHLVYVGDDCHYNLNPGGSTCTLWDWDPATPTAPSRVFARLSTPMESDVLIDGLYFDPSGTFLFAAHREQQFIDETHITKLNTLDIIERPVTLRADSPTPAPVDQSQLVQRIAMKSEPDGVAFHAGDGFVVTLNESLDCVDNTTNFLVASNPVTDACPATATPIGGTMTRFDFAGANYRLVPTVSTFARGGFRGDLAQVGPDGCIYATQAPLSESGGTSGTRYDNDVTSGDNSIVQICGGGGFVIPPGVETAPASLAGLAYADLNNNHVWNVGEPGIGGVTITLSGAAAGTTTTAGDGTYSFTGLAAGSYSVAAPATAAGLALGTASPLSTTLTAGQNKTGLDFGYVSGGVSGVAFADLNKNGAWDAAEPGIGGVTITLTHAGAANRTTTTASDGSYSFAALVAGTYSVSAPATAGDLLLFTTSPLSAIVAAGQYVGNLNFGYVPPISVSCVATTMGQVGVAYSASLVATGGATPYLYSITGDLPAGLTLDASTGVISGTPTATGSSSFSAQVIDAQGSAANTTTGSSCGITIASAAPTLSCVAATTGQVGVAYNSSLVATGGVGPYTYSIISGSLPTGLTLNAATGAITGTPTTAGPFSLTARVVDSRNSAAGTTTGSSCGITIGAAAPALSCVAATTGQVGVAYNSSLVATGGVGPYTYSIISGSLPTGLTLNASSGAITGTPTTAGPFSFTAKVVDSRNNAAGTTTGGNCGVTIAPVTPPPTLSCVAATTGQVGVAYNSSLVATGGAGAPYTYSIISGSLPTGLTLNASSGAITGTPTAAGSFPFTAKVVDSRGTAAGTSTKSCGVTTSPLGSIAGFAYKDLNRNSVKDSSEPGIPNVSITLAGGPSVMTNATGAYIFVALVANPAYSVSAPATAAGLNLTTASPLAVNLAAGQVKTGVNFGYSENTAPICAVFATATPPYMTYQDAGSGIVRLDVTTNLNTNFNVTITPTPATFVPAISGQPYPMPTGTVATFSTPTNALIKVSAVRINTTISAQLTVKATDAFGNTVSCDPVETTVTKLRHERGSQTFTNLPYEEHVVTIENGNPGLRAMDVIVNGVEFRVRNIDDNEVRVLDVKSAMHRRRDNTITLVPRGKPGDSADVSIGPGE